ncbi:MAG TPA: shikimate kinase [Streptosporangiaceae bacterium]|jgi:shikimate kinase
MNIALIGPPGARVSETGQALAVRLGVTLRDTDRDVETQAGKPVGDIFLEDGEEAFRELERQAAAAALSDNSNKIVVLGSGAILDETVREQLKGRTVVYLAADFGTVVKHAGLDKPRVVLPGNPRARLRAMLEERARTYESVATITVQSEDASGPEDLAQQIEQRIEQAADSR